MMTYQWEIIFDEEVDSIFVMTFEDDILAAAQTFRDNYGMHMKVYGIRKDAEIKRFEEVI